MLQDMQPCRQAIVMAGAKDSEQKVADTARLSITDAS